MAEKELKIGKDLKLMLVELGADLSVTRQGDFDTVRDEDNLAQAIIVRLATDQGELADLGHAYYGSRLHGLIGEINNEATRQRVKAVVRECLTQEPRIREVTRIDVVPDPDDPHRVNIDITVLPVESGTYLTIIYPFRLEG